MSSDSYKEGAYYQFHRDSEGESWWVEVPSIQTESYIGRAILFAEGKEPEVLMSVSTYESLQRFCKSHETHAEWRYFSSDFGDRLLQALERMKSSQVEAFEFLRRFQEDTVLFLRAISLVAQSAANGGTHAEKEARSRGLTEMIESAIRKVKEAQDFLRRYNVRGSVDLFEVDYPVREYVHRIHELERLVKELREGKDDGPPTN